MTAAADWTKVVLVASGIGTLWLLLMPVWVSAEGSEPLERQWQTRIEDRYREFEATLGRAAELIRGAEPERAALLAKAFSTSRKELVLLQLREVIERLEKGDFDQAVEKQEELLAGMNAVLDLLLSEDRAEARRREQAEAAERVKQARALADRQRQLRAQTDPKQGMPPDSVADSQLAQDQEELADQTAEARRGESPPESKQGDKKGEKQPNEGEQEKNPNSEPGEEQKEDSQPPSQEQSSGTPRPGDARLESAEKSMRKAKEQIDEKNRAGAAREQDKAIEDLEDAAREAEEKLRQLREEERQELLANLQSRLSQLLDEQRLVRDETEVVQQRTTGTAARGDRAKLNELARREGEIARGLDQVLAILVEDGTAVAFPETIEQASRDADSAGALLAQGESLPIAVRYEEDIIEALSDLVESLRKEMTKKDPQKSPPEQNGAPGRSPLVEKLAELKMVRSLQERIHRRTTQLGTAATLSETDRSSATAELAERQHRVFEITREIAEGPTE